MKITYLEVEVQYANHICTFWKTLENNTANNTLKYTHTKTTQQPTSAFPLHLLHQLADVLN